MSEMKIHSDEAWAIASCWSYTLASDTRTLAAQIDALRAKDADTIERQAAEIERLRGNLMKIAANDYGLQGIFEEHSHDTNAYNYHAMRYFSDEVNRLKNIARVALGGSNDQSD